MIQSLASLTDMTKEDIPYLKAEFGYIYKRKDDYVEREEKTLAEHECKRLDLASEKEKGTCFTKIVVAGEEYKVESISEKIEELQERLETVTKTNTQNQNENCHLWLIYHYHLQSYH